MFIEKNTQNKLFSSKNAAGWLFFKVEKGYSLNNIHRRNCKTREVIYVG